ncbi:ClpX C4-type zinc finger protein [Saccharothrix hoggarensis]|uniref:ClpX C4-type zinc finger protein n=1 Tax=Saccharothrix hoggarensis TaxID=913853 RepID=A0ABW3QIM8_9PSEU
MTHPPGCSFCGKAAAEVRKIVSGPGIYICDGCVSACVAILDADAENPAGDGGTSDVTVPEWSAMSDDELLGHLPRIAATAAQVETGLRDRVAELRDRGVTWARIGAALGMSRQSAWERFA